jgi:hypothetical protein
MTLSCRWVGWCECAVSSGSAQLLVSSECSQHRVPDAAASSVAMAPLQVLLEPYRAASMMACCQQ